MVIKRCILLFLSIFVCCYLFGCKEKDNNSLLFATSAEYPPFEYNVFGKLSGFDIDLAILIADQLGKKAKFQDMKFSAILPAVQNGIVDAAIATIAITKDRKNNFDFSIPYYLENLAIIFYKDNPIKDKSDLVGKKIACQLGTTMDIWLREHAESSKIITMDNNPQAIEMLKAGRVDAVLVDAIQAIAFIKNNHELAYTVIGDADAGYGVALKKGSALTDKFNQAILNLKASGEIDKLKKKYLKGN